MLIISHARISAPLFRYIQDRRYQPVILHPTFPFTDNAMVEIFR